MKFSETWLRSWANPDLDTDALAHQLTMLGLEVDGVSPVVGAIENVVVGEVLEVVPHPNADRLRLCRVDTGGDEPLSIVCGAANVRQGVRYPTALVGARLPGGLKIRRSKIRGEPSEGMMCSAVELGLGEDAEGIYELDASCQVGDPITRVLGLDDHIIDIDLTPNRADCFSIIGIARDVAAANRLDFAEPEFDAVPAAIDDELPVRIEDKQGCARFVGRVIRRIDPAAQTPVWMQERLRRSGIRSIHPVVDVTSYVMLELGQPMHGYDLGLLDKGIVVRRGKAGEKLTTLDGQEVTVDEEVLVIADSSGPVGLAGIMGGLSTAVSAATCDVYLEAAWFAPGVIAGRSRRFGLHTDASMRFERGVDPQYQVRAMHRATQLLCEIAGGQPGPVHETVENAHLPVPKAVFLRRDRLARLLGIDLPDDDVVDFLTRLQMKIETVEQGWRATPPSARFDIAIEADLIEEVGRIYGYENIPETPAMAVTVLGHATERQVPVQRARTLLVDRGYQEVITYSFVSAKLDKMMATASEGLSLSNPISSELTVMRQSLWGGLLGAVQANLSRQQTRLKLFESGVRFLPQDADIIEEEVLSGVAIGSVNPEHWDHRDRQIDLFDVKADIEAVLALSGMKEEFGFESGVHPALHPGCTARITRGGNAIGWLGALHPRLVAKHGFTMTPVLFEFSAKAALASRKPAYQGISKFPAVRRDIAVIIEQTTPVSDLESAVRQTAGDVLRDLVVFDVYQGKGIENGRKSVALGLILQETSRTLNEAEVDGVIQAVVKRLSRDFGAIIRE